MISRILIGALIALAVASAAAADAGAVVVRTPSGQILGVTPRHGVRPTSFPDAVVPRAARQTSSNGNLDYHGGPVLHSSAPYLIFWDPSSSAISAASRKLLAQYFTDVAADNGKGTNVYAVNRQFPDGSGIADYKQTFDASHVIGDTQAYPGRDLVNCADTAGTYPNCLTDSQLQTELTRLINVDHLPTGTGANAPIYFIVTPGDTNVCSSGVGCASNSFCAYHGSYTASSATVLYSAIPMFFNGASPEQDPKACQFDNNTAVQEPNGDIADVQLKGISHEHSETLTDPTGTGWWDTNTGNENGDNCNDSDTNANAFSPTLGGGAAAGTLYNQSINGHPYYLQSEWSNGDVNCVMQPSSGTLTAQFAAPGSGHPGSSISFDPTASTSAHGFSSAAWDFGDGGSSFSGGSPSTVAHTFASGGTYTVKLTLVDRAGNLSSVTHQIVIGPIPSATFTFSPTGPVAGDGVHFDASGSSDPNAGATLTTYSWNFGDGTFAAGPAPDHAYARAGSFTVTLTVTDNLGLFDSISRTLNVVADELPSAQLSIGGGHAETGLPVAFDGSSSSDPDGSIARSMWNFGDGSAAGLGTTLQHVYTQPGTYAVVLTVVDSGGAAASATRNVIVAPAGVTSALHGRSLRVSVDQAGTVSLGRMSKQLTAAGTVSFKLPLAKAQRRRLHARHALKLKLKVVFVPAIGQSVTQKVTVKLRG